jgi:hypothetical protein
VSRLSLHAVRVSPSALRRRARARWRTAIALPQAYSARGLGREIGVVLSDEKRGLSTRRQGLSSLDVQTLIYGCGTLQVAGSATVQNRHLVAVRGSPSLKHSGQDLVGPGSPKTVFPRRAW